MFSVCCAISQDGDGLDPQRSSDDVNVLEQLEVDVELEGHAPGSPGYEVRLRARKVEKCKELQEVTSCTNCRAAFHCNLLVTYRRDLMRMQQNVVVDKVDKVEKKDG